MIRITTAKKKVTLNMRKDYCVDFNQIPARIAGLPVYQNDLASILTARTIGKEEKSIKKMVQDHAIDKILLVDSRTFKKIVRITKSNEIDVDMIVTKSREIMLYISYGVDPAILIITLIR